MRVVLCILLIVSVTSGCTSYHDRETFLKSHSLDNFMADRPQAADLLRQHPALEEWLRTEWNQLIKDYQLVWDNNQPNDSSASEWVPFPEDHLIAIRVSKKLLPADQLLTLSFEICNAQGFPRVDALEAQAAAGKISRPDFVDGFDAIEYDALLRMKENFPKLLPLSGNDATAFYRELLEVPAGFREYQTWSVRTHSQNYIHAQDLYGRRYDRLVKGKKLSATPNN